MDKARALLYSILRFCSGETDIVDMEEAPTASSLSAGRGLSGGEETLLRRFAAGCWKKSIRVLAGAAIAVEISEAVCGVAGTLVFAVVPLLCLRRIISSFFTQI